MKNGIAILLTVILALGGCTENKNSPKVHEVDWEKHTAETLPVACIVKGCTYLPVYSQIYQMHASRTYDLTATASIRNMSPKDTIYLQRADYYNAEGCLVRSYLHHTVYLKPLETLAIVISENDRAGGTGSSFLFDWAAQKESDAPLFEGVMISTSGQQGISFLTRGVRVDR